MVKVPGSSLGAVASRPLGVLRLVRAGWEAAESTVVVRVQEFIDRVEDLVVVDDLRMTQRKRGQ